MHLTDLAAMGYYALVRGRRMGGSPVRRTIGGLAVLVLLFFAVAAPRGFSGGFGGGRGGFGGGFHGFSGGFGGGRSGYSSTPRPYGGWGGGYPVYGPRFYFGPRFFFIPSYGPNRWVALVVLGVIAVVVASVAVAGAQKWLATRYATVSLGLNLRHGRRYSKRLDALVAEADFTTPAGRAAALHRIANMIDPADVVDGFLTIGNAFAGRDQAGARAEAIARNQMQRSGINPEAVNVATPDGLGVRLDGPAAAPSVPDDASTGCVLAVVATVRRTALPGIRSGGEGAVLASLLRLHEVPGKDMDALYFYYAPSSQDVLDPVSANRLFGDLRADAAA